MTVEMRVKLKLFKKLLPGYLFFFGSLLIIGLVYGFLAKSLIGVIPLFFCFISLRYTYNRMVTYHNDSTKKCIALSIALFAVSCLPLMIFNMKITLLSSIPIAIGMTWFLHVLGVGNEAKSELKKLKTKKPFNIDNCTEEELVGRCKQRFTRDVEYKTERAIKHFILKLPHEEIDVNPEQSKKEQYRFRKLLE